LLSSRAPVADVESPPYSDDAASAPTSGDVLTPSSWAVNHAVDPLHSPPAAASVHDDRAETAGVVTDANCSDAEDVDTVTRPDAVEVSLVATAAAAGTVGG